MAPQTANPPAGPAAHAGSGPRAMISFRCSGCGRSFSVPEAFAGRRAKCKSCGAPVVVPAAPADVTPPQPPPAGAPPPAPQKVPMRLRRLASDARQMATAFENFPAIQVRSLSGDPPEAYQVEYYVKGLARDSAGRPVVRERHTVEIRLTSEYPRSSPKCKMLTPVFHPNIDPATICVGDHWTAGERLVDLVVRIGEMIAYQAYNIKSPLDGEAAMWADLNPDRLPIDGRSLRPADGG